MAPSGARNRERQRERQRERAGQSQVAQLVK